MDRWQFCQIVPSVILPMRPDEAAGLLVSDVDFEKGWLEFGSRLAEVNFTKGIQSFKLPFPAELRPVLRACIGGRREGPLLRSRRAFEKSVDSSVASFEELRRLYDERLLRSPRGTVQAEHDRKLLFRGLLRELGGVSEDALAREFKKLLAAAGV